MARYGQLLREAREKQGLSVRSVAKRAGLSEAHLRYIEHGQRDTKPETLRKLARIIGADEKKLIEAWFQDHLNGFDYEDLLRNLPKGFSLDDLKAMYSIEDAKKILEKTEGLTVATAKSLTPSQIVKLRLSLQNALNLIKELETVSKK